MAETLHIVFSDSGARTLREALAATARRERVICHPDDLSHGPIDPPDPEARLAWMARELQIEVAEWRRLPAAANAFWRRASTPSQRRVAWLSRRSTAEYCGFLEFVWRLGEDVCGVVDTTGLDPVRRRGDGILIGLADKAAPLDAVERDRYRRMWRRLRAENAALRVLGEDGPVSAPITYFDAALVATAAPAWRKTARVIGDVMARSFDDNVLEPATTFLAARVRALAAAGVLEGKGDLSQIRFSEVRLPAVTA